MPLPLTLRRSASTSTLRGGDTLRGWREEYPLVSVLNVPLAVRLKTAAADRHVSYDVRGLSFRSTIPGGFASCELQIDRPLNVDPEEIALYGDLYVYDGRSGAVVWQGRLEDPGRGATPTGETWTVRAVGPSAHARDRKVKLIYIDRSLERFLIIGRAAANPNRSGGEDMMLSDGSDAPGLRFRCPRGVIAGVGWVFGRHYRELNDGGQDLARVYWSWDAGKTDADWFLEAITRSGIAGSGTVARQLAFNTTGGVDVAVVVSDFPAGDDILELRIRRLNSSQTPADETSWGEFSAIYVLARRYDKAGALVTSYTSNFVLASDVVEDLLGRLLDQYDGDDAAVTATTFQIDQLAYPDGVSPADVLADLMRLESGYYWAAWEDTSSNKARFEWRAWPTSVRYEATAKDGFDSPGSAAELYNAVTVRWRASDGRLRRTRRTLTVDVLDDAGLTREELIDLGDEAGGAANAAQVGDEFLSAHSTPPNAGVLQVASKIYDRDAGRSVDPWEIRPGHLISVRDVLPRIDSLNPTDRDAVTVFRVVAVEYDAASNTARLELDSSPRTIEQMLSAADRLVSEGRRRR